MYVRERVKEIKASFLLYCQPCVMSYLTVLQLPVYWQRLSHACIDKIERGARSTEVWQQITDMQLVKTYRDIEAVFLESHVDAYWGRFAVFIRWLQRHDLAFHYWRHLVQDHPELVTRAICELTTA